MYNSASHCHPFRLLAVLCMCPSTKVWVRIKALYLADACAVTYVCKRRCCKCFASKATHNANPRLTCFFLSEDDNVAAACMHACRFARISSPRLSFKRTPSLALDTDKCDAQTSFVGQYRSPSSTARIPLPIRPDSLSFQQSPRPPRNQSFGSHVRAQRRGPTFDPYIAA